MSLTAGQREKAVAFFEAGQLTTAQIASKIRSTPGTIGALRANWTRGNNVLPEGSTSIKKVAKSRRIKNTKGSSKTMVVRIQSKKITTAVREGRPVEVVFSL